MPERYVDLAQQAAPVSVEPERFDNLDVALNAMDGCPNNGVEIVPGTPALIRTKVVPTLTEVVSKPQ